MNTIAVVGVGIMGKGIVNNFLKNKYRVVVWSRNKNKLKKIKGAEIARSPKEATESADIIFEVTANDKSSRSVWLGKNGILAGSKPNSFLITCATISTSWVDELAKRCTKGKRTFFDMPMTGGRIAAETGNLTLLVGGDKSKLKRLEKDLQAISGKILYFGKAGMGMRYKLVLNLLQSVHIAGLGEAFELAKELGLNLVDVGHALTERPGGVITKIGFDSYIKEPKPITFSVEWITKDLIYAKKTARKIKTPLLDQVLKKYKGVVRNHPQKDWTYINKVSD